MAAGSPGITVNNVNSNLRGSRSSVAVLCCIRTDHVPGIDLSCQAVLPEMPGNREI